MEQNCNCNPKRDSPGELDSEKYEVKIMKRPYYQEAEATCKLCGKTWTGNDHPGYHSNYWSWM